jgi:hypothetical protein
MEKNFVDRMLRSFPPSNDPPKPLLQIVDAITAAVTSAQAGLNWLRAEPPDLEEVRQVLNFIASDGKRAAEIVIRPQSAAARNTTFQTA